MDRSPVRNAVRKLRSSVRSPLAREFNRLWYDEKLWTDIRWRGVPVLKNPCDLWIYQEIIHEVKPDLIVETGTYDGGSAYFFASLFDLVGNGRVITIDVEERPDRPVHDRVRYVTGSSIASDVAKLLADEVKTSSTVMVVLDSDHAASHVKRELEVLSSFVTVGSYLVVEDTNVNGHPVYPEHGPGPAEAVRSFLKGSSDFVSDTRLERFLLTFNPGGFLRRVR
jgi:cephalosporin hydroxylase